MTGLAPRGDGSDATQRHRSIAVHYDGVQANLQLTRIPAAAIKGACGISLFVPRHRGSLTFVTARGFALRGFLRPDCSSPRSRSYMLNG